MEDKKAYSQRVCFFLMVGLQCVRCFVVCCGKGLECLRVVYILIVEYSCWGGALDL
ncbi:MAG: hypothetical protein FWD76_04465 [Firmicutes bacterium]|nr:hypothetical protein [Bacillota bacterium]